MLQQYLTMMKTKGQTTLPMTIPRNQLQRPMITAGGKHTRKRSRNKARRTRKLLHARR
jgi:hypothetical protein